MRIGIIGAGAMARALGAGWARAGHEVFVGARTAARGAAAAEGIGSAAVSGSIRAAAEFGDVVLLAVPPAALAEVLADAGPLAGKVVVDPTNAFAPDAGSFALTEAAVAERVAATVPDARVVKAFNTCAAEVWAAPARVFDDRRLLVPICGDDPAAVAVVAGLAADLDLAAVPAGGLRHARYLEAATAFVVGLWFAGADARAMLPPLEAAFAVPDAT
ncbi:NADPH-dependent F420 reductase [Nocardia stercoris]|uniref:NADP oxidoreductase n=1 Tax=Nocardia stercoris TaxID=2483361 RepID=A0A3M2KYX4_9NOCA|nr:NAD(P)-binding domain-containing protein [Nocardia stercoris]RMI29836.1 NADP oxidoreductase [Nocardia stercoris]